MTVERNLELARIRIRVPAAPAVPERPNLPWVGLVAPLLAAGLLWVVTGSPYALVLGVVGPAVALGAYGGSARKARRVRRDLAAQHDSRLAFVRRRSAERLQATVRTQRERYPTGSELLAARVEGLAQTGVGGAEGVSLRLSLGYGPRNSLCDVEDEQDPDLHLAAVDLAEALAQSMPVPIVVSADEGVALIGPLTKSRPLARSLLIQALAVGAGDCRVRFDADGDSWSWCASSFTNGIEAPPRMELIERKRGASRGGPAIGRERARARIILAEDHRDIREAVGAVVDLRGSIATVAAQDPLVSGELLPDGVTVEECCGFLRELPRWTHGETTIPARVLAEELRGVLPRQVQHDRSDSLPAVLGMGAGANPVEVDLVREGPHALVAGATGSGKSELLLTWLLSLAETQPPERLAILLVDFKGGATFDKLRDLPHTVGVVTDLDEAGAERAVLSLAAEVRSRERRLQSSGVSEWVKLPPSIVLPRLVVAVDEFAALAQRHAALATLFADVAARGRSLGIHLLLCTQRPTGVFTESIAANCPLRLCLRVNTESDRVLMCGTAGSELRGAPSGRVVLSRGGSAELGQAAIVGDVAAWVRRISESWTGCDTPGRPWLDALPALITVEAARAAADTGQLHCPSKAVVLGVLDDPDNRRQPALLFRPEERGALLVLGGPRSGKSTLIASVASQCDARVATADEIEGAWDAVMDEGLSGSDDESRSPLLIDDLDLLISAFADETGTQHWLTALAGIMRRAGAGGRIVVATASRASGALAAISAATGERLLLRQGSPHDHALAGLDLRSYDPRARPGQGWWAGLGMQVAVADRVVPARRLGTCRALTEHDWCARPAVISGASWRLRSACGLPESALTEWHGEADPGDTIVHADPTAWLSRPSSLAAVRARRPLLFHECSPADFRAVLRTKIPPPALQDYRSRAWLSHPDGRVERVSMAA